MKKTNIVVKQSYHCQGMEGPQGAAISLIRLHKQAENFCLKTTLQKEDPRQKPSGMTLLFNTPSSVLRTSSPSRGKWTHGFTLIELLVVVLIIGILAAVAVPQYKVAVAKSRIAAILPIIETIRKTEAAYYLANGKHTGVIQELDIDIPCTETAREEDNIALWACGRDFLVQASESNAVYASYCPNHNSSYETCAATRDIQIAYNYWNGTSKGTRTCIVMNDSKLGEKVCKTLGEHTGGIYYRMN